MTSTKETLRQYRKELAKIEPRYLALKEIVVNLEKLHSLDTAQDSEIDVDQIKVNEGTFEGLTTKEAALTALYLINATVRPVVVADLLESNGFKHESKNFANTVNTALERLKVDALVEKVPNKGWMITGKGAAECQYLMQDRQLIDSFVFGPTAS